MFHLLLVIIYLSFISLGLPDGLLGAAWPTIYPALSVPVSFAGILFPAARLFPACSATGLPSGSGPEGSRPSVCV